MVISMGISVDICRGEKFFAPTNSNSCVLRANDYSPLQEMA